MKQKRVYRQFWQDSNNLKKFLADLGVSLGIRDPSDWKNISSKMIQQRGGSGIFNIHPSLHEALKCSFPGFLIYLV